jgi:hypothetical protein
MPEVQHSLEINDPFSPSSHPQLYAEGADSTARENIWRELVGVSWNFGETGGPNVTIDAILNMDYGDYLDMSAAVTFYRDEIHKAFKKSSSRHARR